MPFDPLDSLDICTVSGMDAPVSLIQGALARLTDDDDTLIVSLPSSMLADTLWYETDGGLESSIETTRLLEAAGLLAGMLAIMGGVDVEHVYASLPSSDADDADDAFYEPRQCRTFDTDAVLAAGAVVLRDPRYFAGSTSTLIGNDATPPWNADILPLRPQIDDEVEFEYFADDGSAFGAIRARTTAVERLGNCDAVWPVRVHVAGYRVPWIARAIRRVWRNGHLVWDRVVHIDAVQLATYPERLRAVCRSDCSIRTEPSLLPES